MQGLGGRSGQVCPVNSLVKASGRNETFMSKKGKTGWGGKVYLRINLTRALLRGTQARVFTRARPLLMAKLGCVGMATVSCRGEGTIQARV